ncbi:MAG: hypothetical protein CMJ49_14045 [Planctomycetaceae bacterium]|nr:hypothetical protein [Planctomycetaceae bacterium]
MVGSRTSTLPKPTAKSTHAALRATSFPSWAPPRDAPPRYTKSIVKPPNPPATDPNQITLITAGAVRDAAGLNAAPGAVAVRNHRVLAAGSPDHVRNAVGPPDQTIHRPQHLLIPSLVNAHAHLQLSALNPFPYAGNFNDWVTQLLRRYEQLDADFPDPHTCMCRSVLLGIQQTLAAGVLRVGDIIWDLGAAGLFQQSPLAGAAFIELFGIGGPTVDVTDERIDLFNRANATRNQTRLGLSPHAPFSTGPTIYQRAVDTALRGGAPLTTHLAEHADENQFLRDATGPRRQQLEQLGKWDDEYIQFYSGHRSAVDWMLPYLRRAPWLLAHCNYVDDTDIALLAQHRASVAYCPRAADYFGHRNHRYRDMIAAGVNVCLGTDSIVCHGSLSILDEMRHLYQRDHTDPDLLLAMATTHGMRALHLNPIDATFTSDAHAGIVAVEYDPHAATDPLVQVLTSPDPPRIQTLIALDTEDLT